MLFKAMEDARDPQDIQKRKTLLAEAARIKSDLNTDSIPEDASEVIFDSLVEGQLR